MALRVSSGEIEAGAAMRADRKPYAYLALHAHPLEGLMFFAQGEFTSPLDWGASTGLRWFW